MAAVIPASRASSWVEESFNPGVSSSEELSVLLLSSSVEKELEELSLVSSALELEEGDPCFPFLTLGFQVFLFWVVGSACHSAACNISSASRALSTKVLPK